MTGDEHVTDDAQRLRLHITSRSGRVRVESTPGASLQVDGASIEAQPDGSFNVVGQKHGSSRITVQCPPGTDVVVGSMSGAIDLVGEFGDVRASSLSSSINVDSAARLDARSTAGSVDIGTCETCRVVLRSGSAKVKGAGVLELSTMSGSVKAESVGEARVRSVSGTVRMRAVGKGDLAVRTVSGTVDITVDPERRPSARLRSLSGSIKCDCADGPDGHIDVRTVSGTVRVRCK